MRVRIAVRTATAIVSVSTFILLYYGLVDLARIAGMEDVRKWLYPLAIDGMVAAAYAATLYPDLVKRDLRYAWFVIILGSGMSLFGQWLHAEETSDWTFAGPVAAAPALCMSLVWHLLYIVSRRHPEIWAGQETGDSDWETIYDINDDPNPEDTRTLGEILGEDPGGPLDQWERELVEEVRAQQEAEAKQPAPPGERLQAAVDILSRATAEGRKLTGADMARELGVLNAGTPSGRKTGLRWLRRAEEELQRAA